MPQCCKTIHIDGSSKNITFYEETDGSVQIDYSGQNPHQYDFICSYSHDYREYKTYTCKSDPTNQFASWIDKEKGDEFDGYSFAMMKDDGLYSLRSPALIPGQKPPMAVFEFLTASLIAMKHNDTNSKTV